MNLEQVNQSQEILNQRLNDELNELENVVNTISGNYTTVPSDSIAVKEPNGLLEDITIKHDTLTSLIMHLNTTISRLKEATYNLEKQ